MVPRLSRVRVDFFHAFVVISFNEDEEGYALTPQVGVQPKDGKHGGGRGLQGNDVLDTQVPEWQW